MPQLAIFIHVEIVTIHWEAPQDDFCYRDYNPIDSMVIIQNDFPEVQMRLESGI